jgi:O-6-methylguanine DNA methyltransferase
MPGTSEAVQPPSEVVPEPVRLLTPSPIGVLGIELIDDLCTEFVIVPLGRKRDSFIPFAKTKRSESLDDTLGRLSEYFAGARRDLRLRFDLGLYDLDSFSQRVLRQTFFNDSATTETYQQIATAAGKPDAYRNVLAILMANPLPIIIPCHRVVTAKSGIGSYVSGARKKDWLLRMENKASTSGRF